MTDINKVLILDKCPVDNSPPIECGALHSAEKLRTVGNRECFGENRMQGGGRKDAGWKERKEEQVRWKERKEGLVRWKEREEGRMRVGRKGRRNWLGGRDGPVT